MLHAGVARAALTPVEGDQVLDHARAHFPDLVPDGVIDLAELPFLDLARARPWYGRQPAQARVFYSTGTSGFPKPVGWTAAEDEWYVSEKRELLRDWLTGCERGFVSVAVGHNADSVRILLTSLGMAVYDAGLSALDLQIERVVGLDPHVLYCSPTILWRLVAQLRQVGAELPSVRRVITNGEVLSEAARSAIQQQFGLPPEAVMDTYGSTEVGTNAATCTDCGLLHFLDGIYPEAVPPGALDGQPDLAGGPGDDRCVLAVSSIKRTSFPVIRLVTYDVVQGLRRVTCGGRERWSIERVVGRCDEVLNYGELFSAHDLGDVLAPAGVARWLAFNPDNALIVVVEGPRPAGFTRDFALQFPLHQQLIDLALIPPPAIHFLSVDYDRFLARAGLPTTVSGKAGPRVHRTFDAAWMEGLC